MPKVTYFLGAGASYKACPILNELGEKMIQLCELVHPDEFVHKGNVIRDYKSIAPVEWSFKDRLLWNMAFFGSKAKEFGTIDTYARRLSLHRSLQDDLSWLKICLSLFFSIWQKSTSEEWKRSENRKVDQEFRNIDPRYLSLMASMLREDQGSVRINPNIQFVSWNYDLQVELAFDSFRRYPSLEQTSGELFFRPDYAEGQNLQICHLNGYHGYYEASNSREICYYDRMQEDSLDKLIKSVEPIPESQDHYQLNITGHINYAWEKSGVSNKTREEANRIFSETDHLIIIGYSFPTFNKDIDRELFSKLPPKCKVFYQDPKASIDRLQFLLPPGMDPNSVELIKDDMATFHLPYDYDS